MKMASTRLCVPKSQFVKECWDKLQIDMSSETFEENDVIRACSKVIQQVLEYRTRSTDIVYNFQLMCNSLWGRFCLKQKSTTMLFNNVQDLTKCLQNTDFAIQSATIINVNSSIFCVYIFRK